MILYRMLAEGPFFWGATLLFLSSGFLYILSLPHRRFRWFARLFFFLAFLLVSLYIIRSWWLTSQPPFKTMFQSLVFLVWNISLIYMVLEGSENLFFLGGPTCFFNSGILLLSTLFADIVRVNLPPALRSAWFIPHVVLYFAGYSFLFLGFLMSVLYLFFPGRKFLGESHWSGQLWRDYDLFSYRAIIYGFTFLSLGLAVGAVWAKGAWGAFWSWDPKENWALITWLVYLIYLHMRYVRGWKGRRAAWLSILGFAVVIMTYIGVNYLPSAASALHAYQ